MCGLRKVAGLFAASMFVLASSAAAEIPVFDSVVYCESLRPGVAVADHKMIERCLLIEEYALSEVEEFWPRTTPQTRALCGNAPSGQASYAELAVCVLGRMRGTSSSP